MSTISIHTSTLTPAPTPTPTDMQPFRKLKMKVPFGEPVKCHQDPDGMVSFYVKQKNKIPSNDKDDERYNKMTTREIFKELFGDESDDDDGNNTETNEPVEQLTKKSTKTSSITSNECIVFTDPNDSLFSSNNETMRMSPYFATKMWKFPIRPKLPVLTTVQRELTLPQIEKEKPKTDTTKIDVAIDIDTNTNESITHSHCMSNDKNDNLWCWNDCHPFSWIPLGLPYSKNKVSDKYYGTGIFCSIACIRRYIKSMDATFAQKNTMDSLTIEMAIKYCGYKYCECDGKLSFPAMAPDHLLLKEFGGPLTIEEYRKYGCLTDLEITLEPPMVILPQIATERKTWRTRKTDTKKANETLNPAISTITTTTSNTDNIVTKIKFTETFKKPIEHKRPETHTVVSNVNTSTSSSNIEINGIKNVNASDIGLLQRQEPRRQQQQQLQNETNMEPPLTSSTLISPPLLLPHSSQQHHHNQHKEQFRSNQHCSNELMIAKTNEWKYRQAYHPNKTLNFQHKEPNAQNDVTFKNRRYRYSSSSSSSTFNAHSRKRRRISSSSSNGKETTDFTSSSSSHNIRQHSTKPLDVDLEYKKRDIFKPHIKNQNNTDQFDETIPSRSTINQAMGYNQLQDIFTMKKNILSPTTAVTTAVTTSTSKKT
jgi:hypothetical protein